jgi:endonuclease YncB( thermonuclease family)
MFTPTTTASELRHVHVAVVLLLGIISLLASAASTHAAGCAFAAQGEGRVVEIIDGRSFRLADGREIRLAGIEAAASDTKMADGPATLRNILAGRDVTLSSEDDAPDRYGRQAAFVFLAPSGPLVQDLLLAEGTALVSADIVDKDCEGIMMASEAAARQAKKGIWNDSTAIKNAEIPDDILAGIGRFAVVEGRVLSVRQAGATTYLNFGRNWTGDFAVTISRRTMPAIEAAGLAPKSLENRRIRVRGWVEARTGPRIELLRAGQIEILNGIEPATTRHE